MVHRRTLPATPSTSQYLADVSPSSWTLVDEEVRIEARGARGSFRFSRLTASDYAFRVSLADGHTLGDAANRALEIDPAFDPGVALLTLVAEQLIASVGRSDAGGQS